MRTWRNSSYGGPLLKTGYPDPSQRGRTFRTFVNALKRQGYTVDWRELRAHDYGAPTSRKRLFLIARRDGEPIIWPGPTHGKPDSAEVLLGDLLPWRTAAEIIDWSLPCPSIFGRKKPLAENTMKRIARGLQKFVMDNPAPFIVRIGQTGFAGNGQQYPVSVPLTTVTSKAEHCLVTAFLAKHFGGGYTGAGTELTKPLSTVTAKDHNSLVTAFLMKYYGTNIGHECSEPLQTITSKHRFGLVTIHGQDYEIVDIGMRMLEPQELFAAQGFPPDYIIDRDEDGNHLSKACQVARCGNAVPPQFAEALVRANLPELCVSADTCSTSFDTDLKTGAGI